MSHKKLQDCTKEELIKLVLSLKKNKKFGLVWEDKPEQVAIDCETKLPVLQEITERAITQPTNQPTNLIIEGDNYHTLSVLNYTHAGKIDVIYIDPPYNTGNKDFIYNDQFVDEEDGFRHSKWLSFMAKRLRLAKQLLADTGVIFISIDDNEFAQLKLLCDEIFGSDNFIANLVWENREGGGSSDSKFFKIKHEYILMFAKSKRQLMIKGEIKEEDRSYGFKDKHQSTRGKYKLIKLNSFSIQYSASLDYEIALPDGTKITPHENGKRGCWRWSKKKLQWGLENDFVVFKNNTDGKMWIYTKQYFKVDHNGNEIVRKAPFSGVISQWSSTLATKQLEKVFRKKVFNYPKPVDLIRFLVSLKPEKDFIVLDFMAGSGTTGQAVLELNRNDGGNRQFILCTNNENGIAQNVTYPRISKVISGYTDVPGIPANLRYFKTDFIDKAESVDQTRVALVARATDMIKVRENTFETVMEEKLFKMYANPVWYSAIVFDPSVIAKAKVKIAALEGNKAVHIYVFSLSNDSFESDFADLERPIELCPIPESILEVYKRIFKRKEAK